MWVRPPDSFSQNETLDRPNAIEVHSNEWSILLGYIINTQRLMSSGGLDSHIYDVGETSTLIQSKRNVGPTNTIGVHSNEWSILFEYYITGTQRYMSPGGLDSHIYDVGDN